MFSEGSAAEALTAQKQRERLDNLFIRPWLAANDLPAALAGADVLCAVLEADAGSFSVPSKVLSYLAAGRPILAAMPPDNLAAETIRRAGAGIVVAPDDFDGFAAAAKRLLTDGRLARAMGIAGRRFAVEHFDVEALSARFGVVIDNAAARRASRRPR